MKPYLLSVLLIIVIFAPLFSSDQNQQQQLNPSQGKYQVIKTKNSEQFV
jgi:thioredoxin-related protein